MNAAITAAYSIVVDLQSGRPKMAIVADDRNAEYILPDGRESKFFSQHRIDTLLRHSKATPSDAIGWIKLAAYNIGYTAVTEPAICTSFEDARRHARDELALRLQAGEHD